MLVFSFASILALYSQNLWDLELSKKTFNVLIIGIISFLIMSIIVKSHYINYSKKYNYDDDYELIKAKNIKINSFKKFIILCICMILSLIYYIYIARVSNTFSPLKIAGLYRNITVEQNIQIPMFGRLCLTLLRAISTVIVCIIVNNYFSSYNETGKYRVIKDNKVLIVCLLMYVGLTIISGERTSLLRLCAMFVLCFSIYWQRNNNYKKLVSLKSIVLGTLGVVLLLYSFSAIRFFVGRSSKLDALDYISLYAGGPVYNFDRFIDNYTKPTMDGSSTFIGIYNNFSRLSHVEVKSVHRELITISSKQLYLGNVYTCFYDYYKDFALVGTIILILIYSYIINNLYYKCKYSTKNTLNKTVLYIFFGSTLFFTAFTEQFYTSYISLATIESLIAMYLMIIFISAKRIGYMHYKIEIN